MFVKYCIFRLMMTVALLTLGTAAMGDPTKTLLNVLYECKVGNEWMTSKQWSEASRYSLTGGGQIFYVPNTQISGTQPLWRLYKSSIPDHMMSNIQGELGYTTEGRWGYPYTTANVGYFPLQAIQRWYKSTTGDHVTRSPWSNQSPGTGYVQDPSLGLYGMARFGSDNTQSLTLSNGTLSIKSFKAAGGIICDWNWNGKQFINLGPYNAPPHYMAGGWGREMQSAFFWYTGSGSDFWNPTEAGDDWGDGTNPAKTHGSPIWVFQNNSSTQQQTGSMPLNYDNRHVGYGGASQDNPLLWSGMYMGKLLDLNAGGMPAVVKYRTDIFVDNPITTYQPLIQVPTCHLTSDFNTFWTFDAQSNTLTQLFPAEGYANGVNYTPSSGHGGVIIATANQSYAMGVYGVIPAQGGSIDRFRMFNYTGTGSGNVYGTETAVLDAEVGSLNGMTAGSYAAGWHYYTTYWMSGTLTQVRNYMLSLYSQGAK